MLEAMEDALKPDSVEESDNKTEISEEEAPGGQSANQTDSHRLNDPCHA